MAAAPCLLRPPRPGDLGWVVQRHGALYAAEHGWDATFEGLVADVVGEFVRDLDPARERAWIAEVDGRNVGSIFLVRHPGREGVAKLRLLLVEPEARGRGVGGLLVRECVSFARAAGYHVVMLWTMRALADARRLYERAGFRLVSEEPQHAFGREQVSEVWELEL